MKRNGWHNPMGGYQPHDPRLTPSGIIAAAWRGDEDNVRALMRKRDRILESGALAVGIVMGFFLGGAGAFILMLVMMILENR